mmetsp:Transcript_5750/g.4940  ORF Transcript_5750/g.4940 Transcript_5750/m.4940 type:complete len:268 (-) Transcript_5750:1224-2027(-)
MSMSNTNTFQQNLSQLFKDKKSQIHDILVYVLDNTGKISESELENYKSLLQNDSELCQILDLLVNKYSSSIKTKEEMVKYIIRRAFKFIKNKIKKEKNLDSKTACKEICDLYFNVNREDLEKQGVNCDDEDEFFNALLPFRKNSKNRTMNNDFLADLFSSEAFRNDYDAFLNHLDETLVQDNKRKIEKYVEYIEKLTKKNRTKDLEQYKRIPWLKSWNDKTRIIAADLVKNSLDKKSFAKKNKKLCKEEAIGSADRDDKSLSTAGSE